MEVAVAIKSGAVEFLAELSTAGDKAPLARFYVEKN
jgi:hypothetical protein